MIITLNVLYVKKIAGEGSSIQLGVGGSSPNVQMVAGISVETVTAWHIKILLGSL